MKSTEKIKTIAVIGCGVIGAGWVARFIVNGINVKIFDLKPDCIKIVENYCQSAFESNKRLFLHPLPSPGKWYFCRTLDEAVDGSDYIQESISENLKQKKNLFETLESLIEPELAIGSSTSSFKPSVLSAGMKFPERLLVAHPFNPVYLLPLVEIVPSKKIKSQLLEYSLNFFQSIGMNPLLLKKEIDGNIADRLLESMRREALWLVNDDITSINEIDDAIKFGFGIRMAQMGLFETYKIGGEKKGIDHFIDQFGPALNLPWSHLDRVPELSKCLIRKLTQQFNNDKTVNLEKMRDKNIVGFLQTLKKNHWGAGRTVLDYENKLEKNSYKPFGLSNISRIRPLSIHKEVVPDGWTDYNGHMTEYRYLQVLSNATESFLQLLGLNDAYRSLGYSIYTLESHIRHIQEIKAGARLSVETQLLGHDLKRARILHTIFNKSEGGVSATGEHMIMHVNTVQNKSSPFKEPIARILQQIWEAHKNLEAPSYLGKGIRDLKLIFPQISRP